MRIVLIGYGRMGKSVHEVLEKRGHSVTQIIDQHNKNLLETLDNKEVDVAIEFSQPGAAFYNVKKCLMKKIPVVTGTTGWNNKLAEVRNICKEQNTAFLYASNFSPGVNILFAMNKKLAAMMNKQQQYVAGIEEIHHIHKKDKPSGTAVTLAEQIINNIDRYDKYELDAANSGKITVKSIREEEVFGNHTVSYESDVDKISIAHSAKSRAGFAFGAVLAAEYVYNREGVYSMKDVLDI